MKEKTNIRVSARRTGPLAMALCVALAGCVSTQKQVDPGAPPQETSDISETRGASKMLEGLWKGEIAVAGTTIGIQINFTSDGAGTIDIPQQNAKGMGLTNITVEPPDVGFDLPTGAVTAEFRGTLTDGVIEGSFEQGGAKGTFSMAAADPGVTVDEPAEYGEYVILSTSAGDLHGSLVIPEQISGVVPVALLIAGSGPTDRNGNSPNLGLATDNLKQIARTLADAGIGSLRYDKRGIGESAGAAGLEEDLRFEDFVNDAAGWLAYLRQDRRVGKIAVVGHSEGAIIGLTLASFGADAYVSVAGPGRPYNDLLKEQLAAQPEAIRDEANAIIESLAEGKPVGEISTALQSLFRPSVQPFLMSAMRYDPAEMIRAIEVPVLIVQGTVDLQVVVTDAEILNAALPRAESLIIDGMNHVLKQVGDDAELNVGSYANNSLPLDPVFADGLTEFLSRHLK